ncbi:MAG: type II secretion system protein, partial [Bdellovibrionales bacterium]|nr:type II secretion system protein [Bdellovibrionales bacterium]
MERGTTLIEVLVSLLIIAIMSLGVMKNSVVAMRASKLTELNHAASSLAISKIEELAAIDTQNLDATFSATETDVAWGGVETTFTRVTSVVVNANDSRDVSVT